MKKLTVILPFLNEGEEVYNTVQNLRKTSHNDIDIILIDDHSTDTYDYRNVAREFDTIYIKHNERQGVAASREEGIDKTQTDYFILMDAHMRFYQNDWVQMITEQLEKDKRCLLCCQTIILKKDEQGKVTKEPNPGNYTFGAYVDFSDNNILNAKWNLYCPTKQKKIFDIPCVLGATYACNKSYWNKLKGLKGLRSYGLDETLISLKVWLEGGTCKLISNLMVGHIYREEAPYPKRSADYIFNQLYIAELFFNYTYKYQTFNNLKNRYPYLFEIALKEMDRKQEMIEEQKRYFKEINTRNIEEVKKFNDKYRFYSKYNFLSNSIPWDSEQTAKNVIYSNIFSFLQNNTEEIENPGLLKGKTGIVAALSHCTLNTHPEKISFYEKGIEKIYEDINTGTPLNFTDGLTGIAFGMNYIINKAKLDIDISEMLEDIDKDMIAVLHKAPLLTFRDDSFFSAGLYYLMRKEHPSNHLNEQVLLQLIKFCEEDLSLKLTFLKNQIIPHNLYHIFSVLRFIEGIKDYSGTSFSHLLDMTANYLELLLPNIESSTDKIAIQELIQRIITAHPKECEHWPKIKIHANMQDAINEIKKKPDQDILFLAQRVGVYNLLFDNVINHTLTEHLARAVMSVMQVPNRWQTAGFSLMNHENYSLEGLAGLAVIFSEQDV